MIAANLEANCRVCAKPIERRRSTLQTKCVPCVLNEAKLRDKEVAKAQRKAVVEARKAEKDDTRARRVALKSRRDWMDEAQAAVNKFVRLRDAGKPCVSSGAAWDETFQAGHYLSRGARPELRFNLDNIHGQSVRDNMHLHGNQAMYRKGLIARIGLERVEALEGPHEPAKWSIDELKTIRDAFRLMSKQLLEQPPEPASNTETASPPPDTAVALPSASAADPRAGPGELPPPG